MLQKANVSLAAGSEVLHTDGLALAHGEAAFLHEFHLRREQDLILQGALDVLRHLLHFWIDIGLQTFQLYLYRHYIVIVDGLKSDEVVAAKTRILYENFLHLHREHVNTLDNEHIIGAALDAVNTTMCALKDEILLTPQVKLVKKGSLPQSEGKAVRVKDLRPSRG